jgi:hypothetical protein
VDVTSFSKLSCLFIDHYYRTWEVGERAKQCLSRYLGRYKQYERVISKSCLSDLLAAFRGLHGHGGGSQRHMQYVAVRSVHNACWELVT